MDASSSKITELGLKKSSARLFPPFSVMMTSRATIGAIAINPTEACTNQGFITCIPNDSFPLYILLHWLRDNVDMFISLASGATFKEISKGVFKEIKLLVPPKDIADRFEQTVGPMMQQALVLQRKNANLRAQRDLLLPKLVSGEIDVSAAGEALEAAE
jgi:type I restriction enzyme S subunit